jgi:hypothetical protein
MMTEIEFALRVSVRTKFQSLSLESLKVLQNEFVHCIMIVFSAPATLM